MGKMPLVSPRRHAELGSASIVPPQREVEAETWTLNQVQGDEVVREVQQ